MVPQPPPAVGAVALHSGSKWLKLAKNKFTWSDSTNFSKQVSGDSHDFRFRWLRSLYIENLSNCCRHKYDQLWIHELFNQTFGRFLVFGPTVSNHWPPFVYGLESARHLLEERPNESRVWAAEEKHYWHFLHNLLNKSMGLNLMNLKKAVAEN